MFNSPQLSKKLLQPHPALKANKMDSERRRGRTEEAGPVWMQCECLSHFLTYLMTPEAAPEPNWMQHEASVTVQLACLTLCLLLTLHNHLYHVRYHEFGI